jgi:hypothetical protein
MRRFEKTFLRSRFGAAVRRGFCGSTCTPLAALWGYYGYGHGHYGHRVHVPAPLIGLGIAGAATTTAADAYDDRYRRWSGRAVAERARPPQGSTCMSGARPAAGATMPIGGPPAAVVIDLRVRSAALTSRRAPR